MSRATRYRIYPFLVLLGLCWPSLTAGGGHLAAGWLHSPSALARLAGRPDSIPGKGTWAAVGESRLYGLADLPVRYAGLGTAGKAGLIRADWETVGDWPVRETRWGVEAAWVGPIGLGLRAEGVGGTVDGTSLPGTVRWGWHAFQCVKHGDTETLAWEVFGFPYGRGPDGAPDPGPCPLASLTWASGTRSLALAAVRGRDGTPHVGIELARGTHAGLALIVGLDPISRAVGPGFCVVRGPVLLMTSHRVHPVLGITHRFLLVLGGGPACRL